MICILVPVLNEISCIEELTLRIFQNLRDESFHLIYIDDGSTDGTLQYIQKITETDKRVKLISRIKQGRGCKRGMALQEGLSLSLLNEEYDLFIEMDGDLSHNPDDLSKGINLIRQGNDVVIASKYLDNSVVVKRSVSRSLISFLNSAIFRLFLRSNITDYSNGYRFYNRKAAVCIEEHIIKNEGPVYLGEVLSLWLKHNLKIAEFASTYTARQEGQSKVIVGDVVQGLLAVADILFRYYILGFKKR